MDINFLLNTFNRPNILKICLESIHKMAAGLDYGIYVNCNDQNPETKSVLESANLTKVIYNPTNIGINQGYEKLLDIIPERKYIMFSDDDMFYTTPFKKYFSVLNDKICIATGQHSPEHPVKEWYTHEKRIWALKTYERGCQMIFRTKDLQEFRPFPKTIHEWDWWIIKNAPCSLEKSNRYCAVYPGGAKHLGIQPKDSTWRNDVCPEYSDEEIKAIQKRLIF